MKNYIYVFIFFAFIFGCGKTDDKLYSYIQKHCDFWKSDSCYIDFQEAIGIKFDTMYIFGEYSIPHDISTVIRKNYTNNKLIEDSHFRIILIKDAKINYETDIEQTKIAISRGQKIKKIEEMKLPCYYRMYVSPKFLVTKVEHRDGLNVKDFFILKNIQKNGLILEEDSTSLDY